MLVVQKQPQFIQPNQQPTYQDGWSTQNYWPNATNSIKNIQLFEGVQPDNPAYWWP